MGGCCTITKPIIINKTGINFIVVGYIMIKVKILTVFILRNIQRIIDLDRKSDMFFFVLLNFFSHIHLFFILLLLPFSFSISLLSFSLQVLCLPRIAISVAEVRF